MSASTLPVPSSPRRKAQRPHPKLPLSAFSPPNSATSDQFPLPPSPSTVHPAEVVDAEFGVVDVEEAGRILNGESGGELGEKVMDVVLAVRGGEEGKITGLLERLPTTPPAHVLSLLLPLPLSSSPTIPADASLPIAFTTIFTPSNASSGTIDAIKDALKQGLVVDVAIRFDGQGEGGWEALEDFLGKVVEGSDGKGTIVLSNLLPPPTDFSLPIVKLLTHASYRAYQSHTATISLFPNVCVKYLPPPWDGESAGEGEKDEGKEGEGKEETKLKEWKRRVKMYLGHAFEAYGHQRIIFGSSSSASTPASSSWYPLARQSLAELGVEQDAVDAVFGGNARRVYARRAGTDEA